MPNTYQPIKPFEEFGLPLYGVEAASAAWKAGALLIATSGTLVEASADPTATVGIANAPASGVTGADAPFTPVHARQMFQATFDDGNAPGTVGVARTDQFVEYGVTKDATTGIWYIDKNKTTTSGRFRIIGILDAIGTIYARVVGIFTYDQTSYEVS